MSYYLDTSAVVAALVAEPHSPAILDWLAAMEPGTVFISDWSHTEVASALSLKVRTGALTLELRAAATSAWQTMHSHNFPTLAVLPEHFDVAANFASQPDLGLRAGDALHLAIAREGAHNLVTLDHAMADAALQLGVPVERV